MGTTNYNDAVTKLRLLLEEPDSTFKQFATAANVDKSIITRFDDFFSDNNKYFL